MIRWLLGYPSSPSSSSSSVYRARSRRPSPVVTNDASLHNALPVYYILPPSTRSVGIVFLAGTSNRSLLRACPPAALSLHGAVANGIVCVHCSFRARSRVADIGLLVAHCLSIWVFVCPPSWTFLPSPSLRSYTTVPTPHAALPPKFPFVFSFLHYASSFFSFSFSSLLSFFPDSNLRVHRRRQCK